MANRKKKIKYDWKKADWSLADRALAKDVGCSHETVRKYRHEFAPEKYKRIRKKAAKRASGHGRKKGIDWDNAGLGTVSDGVLAKKYGVTRPVVYSARLRRGIPAFDKSANKKALPKIDGDTVGRMVSKAAKVARVRKGLGSLDLKLNFGDLDGANALTVGVGSDILALSLDEAATLSKRIDAVLQAVDVVRKTIGKDITLLAG